MKYTDRTEFLYDSEIFKRSDTVTALKIHAEFVKNYSPIPNISVFEVSRSLADIDPLWHTQTTTRVKFDRELKLPAIMQWEKLMWPANKIQGAAQKAKAWFANLHLKDVDYFPERGDQLVWGGYRFIMTSIDLEPNAYWCQTNVWLGLVCTCALYLEGDRRPLENPKKLSPGELKQIRN